MKKWNKAFFISFFFLAIIILGTGCPGDNSQTGVMPQPPAPPAPPPPPDNSLELAQQAFVTKVFPFFNHDRCVNCHDFVNRKAPGGPLAYHPAVVPNGNPATCTGCHSLAKVGFNGWVEAPVAPDNTLWVKDDDPLRIRNVIISIKGPLLYKHLVGTGADADEFVQWCFADDILARKPPDAPPVIPGGVPAGGPHNPNPIPDAELITDWPLFQAAVDEWICRESRIPGAPDLGKPASLDCSVFP